MKSTVIAVDVAKNVFEIAVSQHPGKVAERHRVSRGRFLRFFAERQPSTVVLEACGSSHSWARRLQGLGHRPLLLPPQYVRPYVRRNKTDRADAKGLLEAFRNEEIRPVPVKSEMQQTVAALHRFRSAWMAERTARINTVRGVLRELGHTIPVGSRHLVPGVWSLLEDAEIELSAPLREVLAEACREIRQLEERVKRVEKTLERLAVEIPVVARLRTIPGVGLLTATALVAFVGDVQRFPSGRHLSSYLGLTPRERSSGNTRRLGRISKRGDVYVRTLLTHGARAALCHAKRQENPDRLRAWALRLERTRGHNKATIALANKLSRIAWAVSHEGGGYESRPAAAVS